MIFSILCPSILFKVKHLELNITYELYFICTVYLSWKIQGIDFEESYSPVAQTSNIRICICLDAALNLTLYGIDIVNAFQTNIMLENEQTTYLSLPFKFLQWYK